MYSLARVAALAAGAALLAQPMLARDAHAHAIAGARVFVPTLTMDDPGVADEASLPTFQWQRGVGPSHEYDFDVEWDKRITETFGFAINYGATIITADHAKHQTGFQNLIVTGKYQVYVNAEHEFLASLGLAREFGGTGSSAVGSDATGSTTPTLYVGKGLGDLPIGELRALGITGELSYTIADVGLKSTNAVDTNTGLIALATNNGQNNAWFGGISLQYNMKYLQTQVRDLGLPDWANRLVPLVEITWSSPATSPSASGTEYLIAPGVLYVADTWDFGVEALIPGNKQTGTNVGLIAQFHIYLDDLFPNSIGRPIFP